MFFAWISHVKGCITATKILVLLEGILIRSGYPGESHHTPVNIFNMDIFYGWLRIKKKLSVTNVTYLYPYKYTFLYKNS